jgi:dihydrodipicolinate synthase/N-acetylneuraminate lyase
VADGGWLGIFPSLCTPFSEDQSVDVAALRSVVRFVLACGAHGIVCSGLAGEVNKLTPDERKRICEVVLDEAGGKAPVLVGVGAEAQYTALQLARHAEQAGANGVVIPPPVTANLTGDDLTSYFLAVANAVRLPVVIQDAPAYLGVALSPGVVRTLAKSQQNVRYVKLESGPEETSRWVNELRPLVRVFTGDAGLHLLGCLRAGAVGNIPGSEITDQLVAVYKAEQAGDAVAADRLHTRLLPYLVFSLQTMDHCNACCKEVLVRRGVLPRGGLREPAPVLAPLTLGLIESTLRDLDLGSPIGAAKDRMEIGWRSDSVPVAERPPYG